MLDGRILAAVFASLAAIAAGVSGGQVNAAELKTDGFRDAKSGFSDFLPGSISSFDGFFQNPEPETGMKAVIQLENLDEQDFRVDAETLYVRNLSSIDLLGKKMESDSEIAFHGFSGNVRPGDSTEISGRANWVYSSGVNVSGGIRVSEEVETRFFRLEGVRRSEFHIDRIAGTISSGSEDISAEVNDTSLDINSFSGNVSVFLENSSLMLEGKVHTLEAGSISFGSS